MNPQQPQSPSSPPTPQPQYPPQPPQQPQFNGGGQQPQIIQPNQAPSQPQQQPQQPQLTQRPQVLQQPQYSSSQPVQPQLGPQPTQQQGTVSPGNVYTNGGRAPKKKKSILIVIAAVSAVGVLGLGLLVSSILSGAIYGQLDEGSYTGRDNKTVVFNYPAEMEQQPTGDKAISYADFSENGGLYSFVSLVNEFEYLPSLNETEKDSYFSDMKDDSSDIFRTFQGSFNYDVMDDVGLAGFEDFESKDGSVKGIVSAYTGSMPYSEESARGGKAQINGIFIMFVTEGEGYLFQVAAVDEIWDLNKGIFEKIIAEIRVE